MTGQSEQAWRLLEKSTRHDLTTRETGTNVVAGPVLHALDEYGARHLLVPLADEDPAVEDARSRGVTVTTKTLLAGSGGGDRRFIDVKCEERSLNDLFSTVCDEILDQMKGRGDRPGSVIEAVLDRWRYLLGPSHSRLLPEQKVKGLIAELHFLEDVARHSARRALLLWTGVDGSRHDFTGRTASVEVKASTLTDEVKVHINGFRQLDGPAEGGTLYLLIERLERVPVGGDSIADAMDRLVEAGIERHGLLQAVAKVGVSAADLDTYKAVKFSLLERRLYLVDDQFPRLVPDVLRDMPAADRISGMEYWLELGAKPPQPLSESEVELLPQRILSADEVSS